MTVSELMEKLKEYDPEADVHVYDHKEDLLTCKAAQEIAEVIVRNGTKAASVVVLIT